MASICMSSTRSIETSIRAEGKMYVITEDDMLSFAKFSAKSTGRIAGITSYIQNRLGSNLMLYLGSRAGHVSCADFLPTF